MTPEQVELVTASAADLQDRDAAWSAAFYDRLFAISPESRALFPDDLVELQAKFAAEIDALVELLHADLPAFIARATALGAGHVAYGARFAHYRASRTALLEAIADVLGDEATPALLEAWGATHDLVAETMLAGAAAQRAVPT